MADSILTSVKKVLGLEEDYEFFDVDVMMHINTAFSTLGQLGVGPPDGYTVIDKDATWDDFMPFPADAKSYTYLRVRLMFDPPATGFVLSSMERQLEQMEWRMNSWRESTEWVDPDPPRRPEEV